MSEEMTAKQLEEMADQLLAEDDKENGKDGAKKKSKLDDKTIASLPAASLLMSSEKLKELFIKGKKKGKLDTNELSDVLDAMGKPHIDVYKDFSKKFYEITKALGKKQYLVPYLMSSHRAPHGGDRRDRRGGAG